MLSKLCNLFLVASGVTLAASGNATPCAQLSSIYDTKSQGNVEQAVTVPAELAYKCLQSMPIDDQRAVRFLEETEKLFQWQTTLDVLKSPPPGYLSPPTDLIAGLDDIRVNVTNHLYSGQLQFDAALQRLFESAHDEHFAITLCTQGVISFFIDLPLVSVSTNGIEMPKVYSWKDAKLLPSAPDNVSPIASINGESVVSFLRKFSLKSWSQDPDAQYNALFHQPYQYPGTSNNNMNIALWEYNFGLWPGSNEFLLSFGNGTRTTIQTTAKVESIYGFPWKNGKDFFEFNCVPLSRKEQTLVQSSMMSVLQSLESKTATRTHPTSSATSTPSTTASPIADGFPNYVSKASDDSISGYFLDQPDIQDLAVLYIPTFQPGSSEFSAVATDFVQRAKSAGKKKLIIDLSTNYGGTIDYGLDLFKLFFPNKEMYTATRFRAHEAMDLVGQALAQVPISDMKVQNLFPSYVRSAMTRPNQKGGFKTWAELFGPHEELGTNMSSLMAVENFTLASVQSDHIRGYGPDKQNTTVPPFAAENILLVTNGNCGSTCTIFSELMKNLAGVKSLAFGGRPQDGPMQALGSTKGEMTGGSGVLWTTFQAAIEVATNATRDGHPVLNDTQLARLKELSPPPMDNLPLTGLDSISVNPLNGYRPGQDHMPLQFIYEPADFRLFYTAENIIRPSTAWAAAANAFWGNGRCVGGSRVNETRPAMRHRRHGHTA